MDIVVSRVVGKSADCQHGRYCLAHAGYAGSNSNMGGEVDWRDIKKLVSPSVTVDSFKGALMQFL